MAKHRWKCPNCKANLNLGPKLLGTKISCPSCKQEIEIPASLPDSLVVQDAPIPEFKIPKTSDSIFDSPEKRDFLDEPAPVPVLPPVVETPAATESNPFDFSGSEAETVQDAPKSSKSKFVEPKTAKSSKILAPASTSRSKIVLPNPNAESGPISETETDAAPVLVPPSSSSGKSSRSLPPAKADTDNGETEIAPVPRVKKPSNPIPALTWVLLAWAITATSSTIYLAIQRMQSSSPTPQRLITPPGNQPAPNPERAKPENAPERSETPPKNDKTEKKK
ncbi:hypothetical protein KIH39_12065 [Telmatocola sphagniphila]|uniref:Uncharacterized protein n=1 Tax=Telmatocola sphagniphila TaxID=1123043 RepID=A0A8E6BA72_9BACT|nr:hypothetical protein [Telmatocola sphagniphila]QVL34606.1 hypothetical protein KIH39_12065 [Telmatocola sphagniphila]